MQWRPPAAERHPSTQSLVSDCPALAHAPKNQLKVSELADDADCPALKLRNKASAGIEWRSERAARVPAAAMAKDANGPSRKFRGSSGAGKQKSLPKQGTRT
jgi:hypothetical protein